jgi:hypothetical protein
MNRIPPDTLAAIRKAIDYLRPDFGVGPPSVDAALATLRAAIAEPVKAPAPAQPTGRSMSPAMTRALLWFEGRAPATRRDIRMARIDASTLAAVVQRGLVTPRQEEDGSYTWRAAGQVHIKAGAWAITMQECARDGYESARQHMGQDLDDYDREAVCRDQESAADFARQARQAMGVEA